MIEFHCSAQFLNAKYPHPHLKIALQFCEDPLSAPYTDSIQLFSLMPCQAAKYSFKSFIVW